MEKKHVIKRKTKRIISTVFRYIVLIIVGIIMFYPMLWMLGGSLKASNNEIFATINFIPKKPSFQAYIKGWNASGFDFGIFMINTYKMVLPKVIGTVISSVITAYGFSRFDFVGKKMLFAILMSTLFLPQVVLNVPQFLMFTNWGWVDTYKPLVVQLFLQTKPILFLC